MFKVITIVLFVSSFAQAQNSDILLQKNLKLKTANIDTVLKKTEGHLKAIAENFNVRLDGNSKITRAKEVIGTLSQPVYKISIKKCVFLFCQTIDLDAEFSLKAVTGQCNYNYVLQVDLRRSSPMLTDLYSFITTGICIQKTASGAAASLRVDLLRASSYNTGIVQKQAFGLISLQGESILEAFKAVMKQNGVTEIL